MPLHFVPLSKIQPSRTSLKWREVPVQRWLDVYRALGIIRPLVLNAKNGSLISPPGEWEALQYLEAHCEQPPAGVGMDWSIPAWIVSVPDEELNRWTLALNGGVDYMLSAQPYDGSLTDLILAEAERDIKRIRALGMTLDQYENMLEILADGGKSSLTTPISGTSPAEFWACLNWTLIVRRHRLILR